MIFAWLGTFMAVLVSGLALWRGGSPEKWGAVILMLGWFSTPFVDTHHGMRYGILCVDVIGLIGLYTLSVLTRQIWALFMVGFQINAVAAHFAALIHSDIGRVTYMTAAGFWGGYGLVAALAVGVWNAWRAQAMRGSRVLSERA